MRQCDLSPPESIPPRAYRWLRSSLSSPEAAAARAATVPRAGMSALQVRDLKALVSILDRLLPRFVRPRSGTNKAGLVLAVRRCFYADPDCQITAPEGDPIWAAIEGAAAAAAATTTSERRSRAPAWVADASPDCDYVDMTQPRSQWGPPRTTGALARAVRVKQERHAARPRRHSAGAGGGGAWMQSERRPVDAREAFLLAQMKMVGFTDDGEILAGLRHVRSGAPHLDPSAVIDMAMVWIVKQREEAEEARKMDMARMISETDRSEKDRREREAARRLQEASMGDIVGIGDDARSKFFRGSVLLRSPLMRSLFLSVGGAAAKEECVRLLRLEQQAGQWYGKVLPWAYFHHVAIGRIEAWADDDVANDADEYLTAEALIRQEADALERALFSLSEQIHNGVQNVPQVFVSAQEDARRKGLPDAPETEEDDDEVIVVELDRREPVTNDQ